LRPRPSASGSHDLNISLLPDDVANDACHTITRETSVQRRLRAVTARLPEGGMQIGPDLGAFLALPVRSIGARRALNATIGADSRVEASLLTIGDGVVLARKR